MIAELKKENIALRKAKDQAAGFSSFVLAEIGKIGKSAGNRETTEDEAITVLKKLLATAKEMGNQGEVEFLERHLPKMTSEEEVTAFLREGNYASKGDAAKALRAQFGALVDMKRATALYEELKVE